MNLARRGATAFARSMAFTNDGRAVCMYGDPHPRDVNGDEDPAVFTREHTAGFERLPAPAVESENPIGFRDRIPALQIGQLATIGLTGADMTAVGITPQCLHLFC